jgi:hypothetical protein
MACPTILFGDRELLILQRLSAERRNEKIRVKLTWQDIPSGDQLKQSALRNPDAVAFGFTRGRWYAAA